MVIQNIRDSRPGYNLISNNCQTYVLQLLDAIQVSDVKEFGTTLAVYDRLFGSGKVADLFPEMEPNTEGTGTVGGAHIAPLAGQEIGVVGGTGSPGHVPYPVPVQHHVEGGPAGTSPQSTVQFAQQVVNANTTQLDTEEQMSRHMDEREEAEDHKGGSWKESSKSFFRKFKK